MKEPKAQEKWECKCIREMNSLGTQNLPWVQIWGLKPLYTSPRDTYTWLKLRHRNLYVANKDVKSNNQKCLACDDGEGWNYESMKHLAECEAIRIEFWIPLLEVMDKMQIKVPREEENLTLFILLGVIDKEKVCCREGAAVLALGWRCLYAEIVRCRKDELWEDLKLGKAIKRTAAMLISRITAYGEKWRFSYLKTHHTSRFKEVPKKHQNYKCIAINSDATYTVSKELLHFLR